VVRVNVQVEHPGAFDSTHGRDERLDLFVIAPLGKIGNAFDQAPHAWWKCSVAERPVLPADRKTRSGSPA
jgi:hypothetical protein